VFLLGLPLIGLVLLLAMSRSNEYRADRFGAEICGDLRDLISVLRKGAAMR
jgi:Zn-dependent protease with chaperone function